MLRHEFVHVITVQQSGFNIPHWFTEVLAMLNEGYPPPSEWMELLARRFPSQLRTLATLDGGSIALPIRTIGSLPTAKVGFMRNT